MLTSKRRLKTDISNESANATEVILERFQGDIIFDSHSISSSDFRKWMTTLDEGFGRAPITFSKCWIPHHRARIITPSNEFVIEFCFSCDEMQTTTSNRVYIPNDWVGSSKNLFSVYGISDKAPTHEEVTAYRQQQIDFAEQDAAPNR
ncbi:hypothetical protein [Rubritalea tangerina]